MLSFRCLFEMKLLLSSCLSVDHFTEWTRIHIQEDLHRLQEEDRARVALEALHRQQVTQSTRFGEWRAVDINAPTASDGGHHHHVRGGVARQRKTLSPFAGRVGWVLGYTEVHRSAVSCDVFSITS